MNLAPTDHTDLHKKLNFWFTSFRETFSTLYDRCSIRSAKLIPQQMLRGCLSVFYLCLPIGWKWRTNYLSVVGRICIAVTHANNISWEQLHWFFSPISSFFADIVLSVKNSSIYLLTNSRGLCWQMFDKLVRSNTNWLLISFSCWVLSAQLLHTMQRIFLGKKAKQTFIIINCLMYTSAIYENITRNNAYKNERCFSSRAHTLCMQ